MHTANKNPADPLTSPFELKAFAAPATHDCSETIRNNIIEMIPNTKRNVLKAAFFGTGGFAFG